MRYTGLYILFVLRNLFINSDVPINDAGSFRGKASSVLLPRQEVCACHSNGQAIDTSAGVPHSTPSLEGGRW